MVTQSIHDPFPGLNPRRSSLFIAVDCETLEKEAVTLSSLEEKEMSSGPSSVLSTDRGHAISFHPMMYSRYKFREPGQWSSKLGNH